MKPDHFRPIRDCCAGCKYCALTVGTLISGEATAVGYCDLHGHTIPDQLFMICNDYTGEWMGMKTIYNCDICREDKNPSVLIGVRFSGLHHFTLGGHGCTEGVHICFDCARQLKTHLNNEQINLMIDNGTNKDK